VYSPEAREFLKGVKRMQQWWVGRQQALKLHGPDSLARNPREVAHLRFDFRGTRAAPLYNLPCERKLALIAWASGATLVLLVVLMLLHGCTQGF